MNQMIEQRQELKERIRVTIHDDNALVQHNYKAIDKLSDAAVLNMWQLHKMLHAMDPLIKYQDDQREARYYHCVCWDLDNNLTIMTVD
jgi:hypothetical protein